MHLLKNKSYVWGMQLQECLKCPNTSNLSFALRQTRCTNPAASGEQNVASLRVERENMLSHRKEKCEEPKFRLIPLPSNTGGADGETRFHHSVFVQTSVFWLGLVQQEADKAGRVFRTFWKPSELNWSEMINQVHLCSTFQFLLISVTKTYLFCSDCRFSENRYLPN